MTQPKGFFAAMLGVAMVMPANADAAAPAASVATTEYGKVEGSIVDGVESWKGIPFAAPPVDALRWQPPKPAARWSGVRETTAYRNDCMQEPFPSDAAPLGTTPSEDCLYLNIWKPAGAAGKLPVMVWIYGGGFVNGGSSPPTYSGAPIARQGVMVVSFNYRLGRFGTFRHPALGKDQGVNYGLLDQIAALKWVQRNIAGFGGDPDQVTIVGESAGGRSVHALMTTPLAKGLFDRAVIMSGGDGNPGALSTPADAERLAAAFGQSQGIAPDAPDAAAKLRALPARAVVGDLNLAKMENFFSPVTDGRSGVDVIAAHESGRAPVIPVMIGATSADIGGPDGPMVAGARDLAARFAGRGMPTYAYRFSYVASSVGGTNAYHATDIPFFFDTQAIKYGAATTPRDNRMGDIMSGYLANFVKTGDPNGADLPQWPRYRADGGKQMDFATSGEAVVE
ncbi:carboxylesterase family protein [Sphingobium soli]|uniref:Carboxylic ester hydrolase n=1 Tax=Sphingobium soli TaxID=1591116 RepID=A0ABS8GYY9_9SPHN|nr:carboxylesterase family protein [Sphingobium soli]MCC4231490.1 carboxylesterase family protein [Sphingobium soli]